MKLFNLMTAQGFNGMGFSFFMAWIGLALLVLLIMLAKKWLGEEEMLGIAYNWFGSLLGPIVYIVVVSFTGSAKFSLIAGLIGMFAGGFMGAQFFGGTE